MPIYVYKCSSCGKVTEELQKVSDPQLTVCPSCGAEALHKQVTAAGFELKGTGWYVTDFRNEGGSGGKDRETNVPSHSAGSEAAAPAAAPASSPAPAAGVQAKAAPAKPATQPAKATAPAAS